MSFLQEIKRRKVIRVGVTYLVAAWLLLQIADVLFDPLKVPQWFMTALIVLLALGFPFALIMAWAFQLTSEGVKRDAGTITADESPLRTQGHSPGLDERSVAVLPFVDISPDHDNEYFTDGLTEELLNALRRVPDLRISSRTSCFAFKGKGADVAEVAEKLHVNHLVEGSVRKSGNKLRVTVQLIETKSDTHLWSECYDENLEEIFSMQEDISRKVCSALQVTLHAKHAPNPTTDDPQAYDYYLRGLGFFTAKGSADLDYAIEMFTRATELDPGFTKAWTQLTVSLAMSATYHGKAGSREMAESAARNLLRLAPEEADTYSAYGMSLLAAEKYAEAIVELKKAIAIDANNFEAHNNYARAAFHQGDLKTALEMFEKAARCDPEDWETVLLSIQIYEKFGDQEGLMTACREGVKRVERFLQIYPNNQRAHYLGAFALRILDEEQKARKWVRKALQIAPHDSATRYNAGCFYAAVGDPDEAFANLKESITSRTWVENDPSLDSLRDDPRFPAYLKTLK
jgi:adenylate cyclase